MFFVSSQWGDRFMFISSMKKVNRKKFERKIIIYDKKSLLVEKKLQKSHSKRKGRILRKVYKNYRKSEI